MNFSRVLAVNPQSYRKKLETAVEQRDRLLLAELEQIADDSPATSRLWQEHCLLERAIEDWVRCSSFSEAEQDLSVTEPSAVKLPSSNKKQNRYSVSALVSGIACLVLIGWLAGGQTELRENDLSVARHDHLNSVHSNEQVTEVVFDPVVNIKQKRKPFAPLDHSYDLVEQSKAFLPSSVLPPVLPEVTNQIAEEVSQTWVRLSVLPEEMQQVWKELNLPTEHEQDEVAPPEKMPAKQKPARRFSFFNMLS